MERLPSEVLSMIMEDCDLAGLIALASTCSRFRDISWLKLLRGRFPALSTRSVVFAIVSTYEDPNICLRLLRKALYTESKPSWTKRSIIFCTESNSFEWVYQTALHVAASRGLTPVVKFLLEKGVSHGRTGVDSRTVLEAAVYADELSVVRTLIDRVAISKEDQNDAIYAAVAIGSKDMLELFLSEGWDLGPNDQTHVFEAVIDSPLEPYMEMIPYLKAHGVQITENALERMWRAFTDGRCVFPLSLTSGKLDTAAPSILRLGKSIWAALEDQEMFHVADVLASIGVSNPGIPDHVIREMIRFGFFISPEAMLPLVKGDETLRRDVWYEIRRLAAQFAAGPEGIEEVRGDCPHAFKAFQTLRDHFHQEWMNEIVDFPKMFVTIVDSLIAAGLELSFASLQKKLFQVPY